MNRLRKNKKGFTLVEIIVVLVIIAILMAALTPVMMGWINEARQGALMAEARTGMMAIQALSAEHGVQFTITAATGTPLAGLAVANGTNNQTARFLTLVEGVRTPQGYSAVVYNGATMTVTGISKRQISPRLYRGGLI